MDEEYETNGEPGSNLKRLWTPWRMRYVGGGAAETGCLFCNRLTANDDVRSLIVHRAERAFAIMNLYPYNTAHLMIVPNDHVASPEDVDEESLAQLSGLLRPVLRSLRRAFAPAGFNIGMNVGAVAGAGVADHLHQHVVPRWQGDANFMPILASTMVLPELIPVSYAKIRAELNREFAGHGDQPIAAQIVLFHRDGKRAFVVRDGSDLRLPSATANPGEPVWRATSDALARFQVDAALAGWAGPTRAESQSSMGLTYLAVGDQSGIVGSEFVTIEEAQRQLTAEDDRRALTHAHSNLFPAD